MMVLLPCGNCCKPSRCGAIRWDGWVGEAAPHGDMTFYFDYQWPYYPQPLPAMPFEFGAGFGTVRVEESLIRFTAQFGTWKFNRFISGETIVLERSGPHDFFGGELIELTQVVHDNVTTSAKNFPEAQPGPGQSAVPVTGYGYKKAIETIGTVSLQTSPATYGNAFTECLCPCTPRPFDGAEYAPSTYTLTFLNLEENPNGPRLVLYDGTSPQAGEPPSLSLYGAYVPTGSSFRGPPPTGFRARVAGCNRYMPRLSYPIVMQRYQQTMSWYSDFIRMDSVGNVARYVFARCDQNVGSDRAQSGAPRLTVLRYYNGIGSNPTTVTAVARNTPCAWNRIYYRDNPGAYTQFLSQQEHFFGEDGNPFAKVTAGGAYAPEGPDFPVPTSVTVTLTSTDQFPVGGDYTMPFPQSGSGVTFPATSDRPALTVTAGLGPADRTCGCDDPFNVFIGAYYGGGYPTGTTWRKSGCYSEYTLKDQTITATNNGKANQSFIFGGYSALVDCHPSATAAFS